MKNKMKINDKAIKIIDGTNYQIVKYIRLIDREKNLNRLRKIYDADIDHDGDIVFFERD